MEPTHDETRGRFTLPVADGAEAWLDYLRRGEATLDLVHTYVPPQARGQGTASRLVERALRYAREHGLRIVPTCPFVRAYLERHPEHRELHGPDGGRASRGHGTGDDDGDRDLQLRGDAAGPGRGPR